MILIRQHETGSHLFSASTHVISDEINKLVILLQAATVT